MVKSLKKPRALLHRTGKEVSFEWLHPKISSTDANVTTTLYSIENYPKVKVLLSSVHLNGHTIRLYPRTQKLKPPYTA